FGSDETLEATFEASCAPLSGLPAVLPSDPLEAAGFFALFSLGPVLAFAMFSPQNKSPTALGAAARQLYTIEVPSHALRPSMIDRALLKTSSNMGSVSLPVKVFC